MLPLATPSRALAKTGAFAEPRATGHGGGDDQAEDRKRCRLRDEYLRESAAPPQREPSAGRRDRQTGKICEQRPEQATGSLRREIKRQTVSPTEACASIISMFGAARRVIQWAQGRLR
jgi:hypothetical protein